MDIFVLNSEFETIGVIDNFNSVLWTERFNEPGELELVTDLSIIGSVNPTLHDYIQIKDSDNLMIVEDISLDYDEDSGPFLSYTGRSLESILDRRVLWWDLRVEKKTIQEIFYILIYDNFISPIDPDRRIPNLIFQRINDAPINDIKITALYNAGTNISELINQICVDHNVGYKITFDGRNNFIFQMIIGEDRSYDQVNNPYIVFSPKLDNIVTGNRFTSSKEYKNVIRMGLEYENAAEDPIYYYDSYGSGSGLERYEVYYDASDIDVEGLIYSTPEYDADGNQFGELPPLTREEMHEVLQQKGAVAASNHKLTNVFDGEIQSQNMYVYGKDFFIGDIVQIETEYGDTEKVRVSEIIHSQDEAGSTVIPTFESLD